MDLPLEATPHEERAGFAATMVTIVRQDGRVETVRGLARPIARGLTAVKVHRSNGMVEYAIVDPRGRAIYPAAASLHELLRRFP